jgi:hypothetical protein
MPDKLSPFIVRSFWASSPLSLLEKSEEKNKTELPMGGHQFGYKQKFLKKKYYYLKLLFIYGFALDMAIAWLIHQLRVHPKPRPSLSLSRRPTFTSSCEREKLGPQKGIRGDYMAWPSL